MCLGGRHSHPYMLLMLLPACVWLYDLIPRWRARPDKNSRRETTKNQSSNDASWCWASLTGRKIITLKSCAATDHTSCVRGSIYRTLTYVRTSQLCFYYRPGIIHCVSKNFLVVSAVTSVN